MQWSVRVWVLQKARGRVDWHSDWQLHSKATLGAWEREGRSPVLFTWCKLESCHGITFIFGCILLAGVQCG